MRQLLIVLGLTVATTASAQEVERSIDPGMSKAQVIERLGPPAAVRSFDSTTYLLYPNGCERSCGMQDLVVLDGDSVVDAVFRSPLRHYTGTSSSPEEKPPVPVHRTSMHPLTVERAAARPVVPSTPTRAETASVKRVPPTATAARVPAAAPLPAATAKLATPEAVKPSASAASSTTPAPTPATTPTHVRAARSASAPMTVVASSKPATESTAPPKRAAPPTAAPSSASTTHSSARVASSSGSPLTEIGKVSAPPVGAVPAPLPKKRYTAPKHPASAAARDSGKATRAASTRADTTH